MTVKKPVATQKRLTRRQVKSFRKSQGWSATRLGAELANGASRGYSRSYVKAIEGGSLPISRFFAQRFRLLRARVIGEQVLNKEWILRGRAPKHLVIAARPKRCGVCHRAFIGATANQKYCSRDCSRSARSMGRKPRVGKG
jgi:hypothetical protein